MKIIISRFSLIMKVKWIIEHVMLLQRHSINLRKPFTEEINRITAEMVAQVQSAYDLRNITVNSTGRKFAGIFMKDRINKAPSADKDSYPTIYQNKDPKTKKYESKKNFNALTIEKKQEPARAKPMIQKDDKVVTYSNVQSQECNV